MRSRLLLAVLLLLLPWSVSAQSALSTTTCPGAGCTATPAAGRSSVSVQVTGTFVGTLTFEQSNDATNWELLPLFPNRTVFSATATTVVGFWSGPVAANQVRARFSAYTSGTANVSLVVSEGSYTPSAPPPFTCVVAVSTATTITAVGGGCVAPGAGLSLHLTDVLFSTSASGIAADAFATLKSGTNGTCGVATTVVWGALSAAAGTYIDHREKPIKLTANHELCWITSTAGSKFLVVSGFVAP